MAISRFFRELVGATALLLAFNMAGCGGSKPNAEQASSEAPASDRPPPGEFYEVSMPQEADEEAEPGKEAPKTEEPKKSEPDKPVRRPQPTFDNDQEIATTIGEGGALMKLGTVAVLRIPEGALRDGVNLRFARSAASADKSAPPRLGESVVLEPKLKSAGPPFELTFYLPEGASAVDLVVPVAKPAKKTAYRIISAKQVDAKKKQALFELDELPGADVYLTAKTQPAPSPPAAKAPASGK